jgi:hypothetical protein
LALTSPTSGDRSVGIFRLRTAATEFSFLVFSDINAGESYLLGAFAVALNAYEIRSFRPSITTYETTRKPLEYYVGEF